MDDREQLINKFWDVLQYYDRNNLITETDMAKRLGLTGGAEVREKLVSPLSCQGEPIYTCSSGIGMAKTAEDIEETLIHLKSRFLKLQQRIKGGELAKARIRCGYDPRRRQGEMF